jgi:hypothetical protein
MRLVLTRLVAACVSCLVAAAALALPVEWTVASGGNGHFYEKVSGTYSWTQARDLAASRSWGGLAGHLATLTSQAENDWVWSALSQPSSCWLGGFQPSGSVEPAGGWQWVTGEPWSYANWSSGEPDNSGGYEDYLVYYDRWGDRSDEWGFAAGFVVEHDVSLVTQQIILRSGDVSGPPGTNDPNVHVLVGPADSGFPNAFSSADFEAARVGPSAKITTIAGAWLQALSSDSEAKWINNTGLSVPASSGLYAVDFFVPCAFEAASLSLRYSVDNYLGQAERPGVYVNGIGLSATNQIGSYAQEFSLVADVSSVIVVGYNTLYLYDYDASFEAGVIFSAVIDLTGDPTALALSVVDVRDDQGGQVTVSWRGHCQDDLSVSPPVVAYDIERFAAGWQIICTVAAVQADAYSAIVATPDILTLGQPAPYSRYRIVTRTANPAVFYESHPDSGYSIDNLPPPASVLSILDDEESRTVFAAGPHPSDFKETCFYRGQEPDFTPGDPIQCSTSRYYDEEHLRTYFYKARNFDIHGNPSEWSNEVTGQYPTDVPGAQVTQLRLYPNQPNPFNPMTTIRFDLPAAGQVRLAIYDLAGRLVRVLVEGEIPAGSHEAVWDGRDSTGRSAPSGSYLARLVAGGKVEGVRLSLVR